MIRRPSCLLVRRSSARCVPAIFLAVLCPLLFSACKKNDEKATQVNITYDKGFENPQARRNPWSAATELASSYSDSCGRNFAVEMVFQMPSDLSGYSAIMIGPGNLDREIDRKRIFHWVSNGGRLIYSPVGIDRDYPDFDHFLSGFSGDISESQRELVTRELAASARELGLPEFHFAYSPGEFGGENLDIVKFFDDILENKEAAQPPASPNPAPPKNTFSDLLERWRNQTRGLNNGETREIDSRQIIRQAHLLGDAARVWEFGPDSSPVEGATPARDSSPLPVRQFWLNYGSGSITFVASVVPFRNYWIGENEHAREFLELAGIPGVSSAGSIPPDSAALVSQPGYRDWHRGLCPDKLSSLASDEPRILIVIGEPPSFLSLLWDRWAIPLSLLALWVVLWIWKNWSRFGLRVIDAEESQTGQLENSLSLCSLFLWKHKRSPELLNSTIRWLALERDRLGLSSEEWVQTLFLRIQSQAGDHPELPVVDFGVDDIRRVLELLPDKAQLAPADFIRRCQILSRLRTVSTLLPVH